jgi:hypothetical protein
MHGYLDHILLVIQAVKLAGRAILADPGIKVGIEFFGGQVREAGYEKSAFGFGW